MEQMNGFLGSISESFQTCIGALEDLKKDDNDEDNNNNNNNKI
jgi:hypothetical protein